MADGFDKHFTRILLVAALGSIGIGTATAIGTRVGTGAATDELVKIRETLTVAVERIEKNEKRDDIQDQMIANLNTLFLGPSQPAR